jgi:peptidoglycan L-alanyl-D-glutamate endopeptidase CwlK
MSERKFSDRTEKNLDTLEPYAEKKFRELLLAIEADSAFDGYTVEIISGSRTYAEQNELFAQGRTKPGKIVTHARGGQSNHNFRIAADLGIFKAGKYLEESPLYNRAGAIGKRLGLEWGGDWSAAKADPPHFQIRTGYTVAELAERIAAGLPILPNDAPDGWTVYGVGGKVILEDLPTGATGSNIVRAVATDLGVEVKVESDSKTLRLIRPKPAAK